MKMKIQMLVMMLRKELVMKIQLKITYQTLSKNMMKTVIAVLMTMMA